MKFNEMNIEKAILDSIYELGFEMPTQIQKETIPLIKQGYDLIGQSETGSGKTAAFGIPLVEKVERNGKIQALVLAPTRELSEQISIELIKFSESKKLEVLCIYGGVPIGPQISKLRYADIVIGTPGRILDHIQRRTINLRNVKTLILDEADKMLDMGFIDDIERIIKTLPRERQTLFFSATMKDEILKLKDRFTHNAKKIRTETKVSDDLLKQFYYDVEHYKKFSLLLHILKTEKPDLSIVFCNTRNEVDLLTKNLRINGVMAAPFHGGLSQSRRNKTIQDFHNGRIAVLVATDVAGRGLDIENVNHIFNYNIPKNPEDYINRIGRTARNGKSGKAISLLSRNDHDSFRRITNKYGLNVKKMDAENFKILPFRKDWANKGYAFIY